MDGDETPKRAAPAAADIEHAVAASDPEVLCKIIDLSPLGGGEVGLAAGPPRGASVEELRVEPEREEVVAKVVVGADCGRRSAAFVEPRCSGRRHSLPNHVLISFLPIQLYC